jgi:FkbM family methyltransferase
MDSNAFAAAVLAYENTNLVAKISAGGKVLRYQTPNTVCLKRVTTLETKEPDTLAWLNGMPEASVYLDVGANVGMYAVYAGVVRQARVYAFEPEAQNFAVLCRNLLLNGLNATGVAWCAALSDTTSFDRIFLSEPGVGASSHSFGEEVDVYLKPYKSALSQGCHGTTIDHLVASGAMAVPAYIKIDVDGFEHKVIAGAAATLRDQTVRSLLVEINSHLPEHTAIVGTLAALGFQHDPSQFERAQRKEGFFKGVGEYIFRR